MDLEHNGWNHFGKIKCMQVLVFTLLDLALLMLLGPQELSKFFISKTYNLVETYYFQNYKQGECQINKILR